MGSAVLFVPPYAQKAEWRRTDDLPYDVRRELERYCLCGVEWEDKDAGSIKCAANDACEGEDCVFWKLTYTDLGKMGAQDVKSQRFGQRETDGSQTVLSFDADKQFKSLRLPANKKDGDVQPSPFSQVIFCSCGTLTEIAAVRAKHESVAAPDGDPPK